MADFTEIKKAFTEAGWRLDHVSRDDDGTERSIYFERVKQMAPRYVTERVRVSDHRLGVTVYGEEQGKNLDADFCLEDYYDDTPASDFVVMAEDDDTREVGTRGITPSMEEWADELEEVRA